MKEEGWMERILITPGLRSGKPCVKGTRISVADIIGWLAAGMSMEEILCDFPQLVREDVLAALAFTARGEETTKYLFTA